MPKITDYTVVTTLDPADSLLDVSIDVAGTPLTRAISPNDLATVLGVDGGSFYNNDGTINDALRTVDMNGNTLYFAKVRAGFGNTPSAGSESFIFQLAQVGEDIAKFSSGSENVMTVKEAYVEFSEVSGIGNLSALFYGNTSVVTDGTQDSTWGRNGLGVNNQIAFDLSTDNKPTINIGNDLEIYNDDGVSGCIDSANDFEIKKGGNDGIKVDSNSTAGNTRFMIYDVDNATLERVTVGVADSGGVGFKVLRIPN